MLRRLAVVLTVVAASVAVTGTAAADDIFGNAECGEGRQGTGCNVVAGSRTGRDGAPVGRQTPRGGSGCRDSLGQSAACSDPAYGVMGSDGCYYGDGSAPGTATRTCRDANGNIVFDTVPVDEGGDGPPIDPLTVAYIARDNLVLPAPVIASSPKTADLQLTRLPTWLWTTSPWTTQSASASAPGITVTATATPTEVRWEMGDGHRQLCRGPGTPYTSAKDPREPSPDCSHTYLVSSALQKSDAYPVVATIIWTITWSSGTAGGTLPPLVTTATAAFRVAETQSLVTAEGVA